MSSMCCNFCPKNIFSVVASTAALVRNHSFRAHVRAVGVVRRSCERAVPGETASAPRTEPDAQQLLPIVILL